jgi:hypothetical protein
VTDYADGKAAWLAEGLPSEGRVHDLERIGAFARAPSDDDEAALRGPGDPPTVRPNELARDVVDRLRDARDDRPRTILVTTAKGRLLGTVDTADLLALARADALPRAGARTI